MNKTCAKRRALFSCDGRLLASRRGLLITREKAAEPRRLLRRRRDSDAAEAGSLLHWPHLLKTRPWLPSCLQKESLPRQFLGYNNEQISSERVRDRLATSVNFVSWARRMLAQTDQSSQPRREDRTAPRGLPPLLCSSDLQTQRCGSPAAEAQETQGDEAARRWRGDRRRRERCGFWERTLTSL